MFFHKVMVLKSEDTVHARMEMEFFSDVLREVAKNMFKFSPLS